MEPEDVQFQSATSGGDGFDSFAASAPVASATSANGGGLNDSFSGSGAPAEPPPSAGLPDAVAAEALIPDTSVTPPASEPVLDDEPFFQHYTPAAQPAPAPEPEAIDPRIEWRKQNNEALKKKDTEESAAKQQLKDTAEKYLARFYEVRTATLTTRKANNRKSEAHQKEVEVPASGTAWEKINSLVNLNSGNHQKDVSRYKAVLITCKAKNVAVKA